MTSHTQDERGESEPDQLRARGGGDAYCFRFALGAVADKALHPSCALLFVVKTRRRFTRNDGCKRLFEDRRDEHLQYSNDAAG
jgi:hypothetical protein